MKLQFKSGERKYYEDESVDQTATVFDDFEAIRTTLGMYPQAFEVVVDFIPRLPYSENPKLDAFIAHQLAIIMSQCAERVRRLGICDPNDPALRLQAVDLSAAREAPSGIDNDAIRQSYFDQSGSESSDPDAEVARSADLADDNQIRGSLGIEGMDADIEDAERQKTEELIRGLNVDTNGTGVEDSDGDDEDDEEGGEGGSGRIQLSMLDRRGTEADPAFCAKKSSELLFGAVMDGYGRGKEGRPGLKKRMQPLVQYDVVTKKQVAELLENISKKIRQFDFRNSV